MRIPTWFLLGVSTLVLGPGCRCNSSIPEEPISTASSRPVTPPPKCPAQPEWAEEPADVDKLIVELLMVPIFESSRKGTGIRIYEDGRVFAFDEVHVQKKDGKYKSYTIPGKWRQHKDVPAERIQEIKALLEKEAPEDLKDWQGKERRGKGRASHLNVRLHGEWLRSCFRGVDGFGSAQERVEALTKKVMGSAYSDEVNRKAFEQTE